MARYNSVNSTSSVAQGSTIASPFTGLLTTITTGSGTTNLPNPVLYAGSTQTFYNATVTAITLSTPSGNIVGPGTGNAQTLSLPVGSVITLTSDGANYVTQAWQGGVVSATAITASGALTANSTVTFNPANANISIQPTGTGTVTINPAVAGSISNMSGSFTTVTANTVNNRYLHYTVPIEGSGNGGTYSGYLLLAKAYISGNQDISYVKGHFTLTRGSTSNGNKSDIFHINSQSAYQSDTLLVTGSTNSGFWSRTCKVTYNSVVYHAIETGSGGGEPFAGVYFTGEFTNCTPIFTDTRYVSNITSYGYYNLTNAQDGTFFTSGPAIFNDTTTTNAGGVKLYISNGANGWPVTSGTTQTYGALRVRGGDNAVLDFGVNGGSGSWLQSTDKASLVNANSYALHLNPNGGNIGVGLGTTAPSYKMHVNGNTFATGITISTGGGTNVANTVNIDTNGSGGARYYSHGGDAATKGFHEWHLASSTGSLDTVGMTLANTGNLSISGTLTESSSIALKENIVPISGALDLVNKLMGKIYDRRDNNTKQESGLIAEEVYIVAPNLVQLDDNGKPLGVKYTKIVAYLVESIKELTQQIEQLKKK